MNIYKMKNSMKVIIAFCLKIFYRYLEVNSLFDFNKNITVLKKEKKPNDVMNITYVFDRENNFVNFPNTKQLGFINSC